MAKRAKSGPGGSSKPLQRSEQEIRRLVEQVETARAHGATLIQELRKLGVPRMTYYKWTKRFPASAPAGAVSRSKKKAASSGRTEGESRTLLQQVEALRRAGVGTGQALKQVGISSSTYHYWLQKYGRPAVSPSAASEAVVEGPVEGPPSVLDLLDEMVENRRRREELEQVARQIAELDARFDVLRRQLGA